LNAVMNSSVDRLATSNSPVATRHMIVLFKRRQRAAANRVRLLARLFRQGHVPHRLSCCWARPNGLPSVSLQIAHTASLNSRCAGRSRTSAGQPNWDVVRRSRMPPVPRSPFDPPLPPGLSDPEKLVLLALRSIENVLGFSTPTSRTLAQMTRLRDEQAEWAVARLEVMGLIEDGRIFEDSRQAVNRQVRRATPVG
jgi:hypothetical protein